MKNKLSGLLIAAGVLFAISCSQNEGTTDPTVGGEEVTVTLTVSSEGKMASSRADKHISDGTKADMLVYAVYTPIKDGSGNIESFNILEQYGMGISEEDQAKLGDNIKAGNGQTIIYTENLLTPEGQTITLRLMRGKTYYFAFWAQNSKSEAFDTENLELVEVKYDQAKNNDELRDAFCTGYSFEAQPNTEIKVVLTRAMAQVNVGTSGWDFINEVDYGNTYLYSKIELTGVYKYINVVTDKVVTSGDKNAPAVLTTSATFDWEKIPAYINIEGVPSADQVKSRLADEEFLKVKLTTEFLDDDSKYEDGYLGYLQTKPEDSDDNNVDGIYTEVFKYLSMCYILAPSHNTDADSNFGTALDNVTFYMAEAADGSDGRQMFKIVNVPAQRNWRTNILGGTGLDNSIFDPRGLSLIVDIRPGYDGDHNNTDDMK